MIKSNRISEIRKRSRAKVKSLVRKEINLIKSNGCHFCGYNRTMRALHFHHLNDDKEMNISRMILTGISLKRIKKEIDKCILVCANCHGEIHEGIITI